MRMTVRIVSLVALAILLMFIGVQLLIGVHAPGRSIAGVTLVYKILDNQDPAVAQRVAEALRKRVDPDGMRRIAFSPLGADRIQVQLPAGPNTQATLKAREELNAAGEELARTNLRQSDVIQAVEMGDAAKRQQRLDELSQGSETLAELLKKTTQAYDAHQAAMKNSSQSSEAILTRSSAKARYHELLEQCRRIDTDVPEFHGFLEAARGKMERARGKPAELAQEKALRDGKIEEHRTAARGFPQRLAAIDNYVRKFDAYARAGGGGDDIEDLKRIIGASGVLEFHILYDPFTAPAEDRAIADQMHADLAREGPDSPVLRNTTLRFFQVDHPDEFHGPKDLLRSYGDQVLVLCYITADKSMVHTPGSKDWSVAEAERGYDQNNRPVVSFTLDSTGSKLFGDLTGGNLKRQLAVILDGKLMTAPTLQSRIEGQGQISGDFSEADIDYIIRILRAGALPARLSPEPESQTQGEFQPALSRSDWWFYAAILLAAVDLAVVFFSFRRTQRSGPPPLAEPPGRI
jgi:preprotein translocase subunit SecD